MVSSKSKWDVFFQGAGIPSRQSAEYATSFSDNRMRLDMLGEINKQVLQDLGVRALGDVIAILRHAKRKHDKLNRSPSPDLQIQSAIAAPAPIKFKTFEKSVISRPAGGGKPSSVVTKPAKVNPSPTTAITNKSAVASKTSSLKNNKQIIANTATTTISSKSINNSKEKIRVTANPVKNTDIKKLPSTSTRLTLSQRFGEFETEAKKKKLDDVSSGSSSSSSNSSSTTIGAKSVQTEISPLSAAKAKTKTLFTIQLPSKQPPPAKLPPAKLPPAKVVTLAKVGATEKQQPKVTVVHAQGKALNRNKNTSSSIFDRLETSSSSTKESLLKKDGELQGKHNVFKRLGTKTDSSGSSSEQKVQVVPPMQGNQNSSKSVSSKSVFNRLGDR